MPSKKCLEATQAALDCGAALLKYISANDAGTTRSHQSGFYLPTEPREFFTPHAAVKGTNAKHPVHITWQGEFDTDSVVTWYGTGTRSEYRLTGFQRGFPIKGESFVGALLVLILDDLKHLRAYALKDEEDIEYVLAALNLDFVDWALYLAGAPGTGKPVEACIANAAATYADELLNFPSTDALSLQARAVVESCLKAFPKKTADDQLLIAVDCEFELFKVVEKKFLHETILGGFTDVDSFLTTANTVLNRRKSRAGKSLEHQMEFILTGNAIQYESQPRIKGKPDILIPGVTAYKDVKIPKEELFVIAIKRTCKDRWRQVLEEAPDVPRKHLLTLQEGISRDQIAEMTGAGIQLVVPRKLHKAYHPDVQSQLMTVSDLVFQLRQSYPR